jgi:phage terminase Nu1 subunit (DNA packaging protein)
LRNKSADIKADEREKNDPLPLRPTLRERRGLAAGQAHTVKLSQRFLVVDSEN